MDFLFGQTPWLSGGYKFRLIYCSFGLRPTRIESKYQNKHQKADFFTSVGQKFANQSIFV